MDDNKFKLLVTFIISMSVSLMIIIPVMQHYHMREKQIEKYSDLQLRLDQCNYWMGSDKVGIQWCFDNIK